MVIPIECPQAKKVSSVFLDAITELTSSKTAFFARKTGQILLNLCQFCHIYFSHSILQVRFSSTLYPAIAPNTYGNY